MTNDSSVTRRKFIAVRIQAPSWTLGKYDIKMKPVYQDLDKMEEKLQRMTGNTKRSSSNVMVTHNRS